MAHRFGGLAQLGERLHGMQEVTGSIPVFSTTKPHRFGTMRLSVFIIVILLQKAPGQYYQPGA